MQSNIIRMMLLSSALSLVLLVCRIHWTGNVNYVFLTWNLFLAWIPLCCAMALEKMNNRWTICTLFCCWLLFFPNSPYILTDLFHLRPKENVPIWFDLVLILSFAWSGLFLGYFSLYKVQLFLETLFSRRTVWLFVVAIMVLCAFGIYLGRYPRWNSWDLLTNPVDLLRNITRMLLHPFDHPRMLGVTFFFSLFLTVSYGTLISFVRHLHYERK